MGLNNEQLQAVNSNSDRILCLAPAGSGKTKTMLERISRLVDDGVMPSSILALTFTNAAGAEMKSRYEKMRPNTETPEFRTFHSFCYSILCKDPAVRDALGYNDIPNIASEGQEKDIIERAKAQCKITIAKDKLVHRDGLSRQEQYQVDLYDKAIRRLMKSENIITFDMLNQDVAKLFADNNPATEPYKEKYKYIAVDEFQDTDHYQIKFLNSFPNTNFYFCGDVLQELYRFRGTSNEYIKALSNTPDWEKIRLYTNYRSTTQICEYANKFSRKYADDSYWIEMKATRDGEKVTTKLVDGPVGHEAINPNDIKDVLKELNNLEGTSAIICRTNKEVAAISSYLKEQDIEFNSIKDNSAQHLIDCAMSDTYMLGRFASYLSSNKYGEYIRLASQTENPDIRWFLDLYGSTPQIRADLKIVNELRTIATRFRFTNVKLEDAAKLLNIKNIKWSDGELYGIEFLQYLKKAIEETINTELYVGTIHSVKGLEYDNVFVMNVGSYSFRLKNEEMKNLFYVAITRAKNRLFVYELFDS